MIIGKFKVSFSWLLLIGTFLLISFLTSLGAWQLERADEKRLIQQDIDQSLEAPALHLAEGVGQNWREMRYRKIEAQGHFGDQFQYYIDNRTYQGKAGYHIIAPFYLHSDYLHSEQQTIILVNRGWVTVGADRKVIPKVTTPTETFTIKGRLSKPRSRPTMIGGHDEPDAYSKTVWTHLDIEYAANLNHLELEPYIILQENDINDGLLRQLPSYESNVTMHMGYAVQWFAFAIFVLLLFIRKNLKVEKIL
ncbi:MAG: hypothetical protein DRQ47_07025 [Gammaproteobacteria bacterium]|nr:MAG: hypothetical protein DRQ47_07025 [Gammaproteobacteria bacterium]